MAGLRACRRLTCPKIKTARDKNPKTSTRALPWVRWCLCACAKQPESGTPPPAAIAAGRVAVLLANCCETARGGNPSAPRSRVRHATPCLRAALHLARRFLQCHGSHAHHHQIPRAPDLPHWALVTAPSLARALLLLRKPDSVTPVCQAAPREGVSSPHPIRRSPKRSLD